MTTQESRKVARAPLAVEVTLTSENNFFAGITDNVSTGGIFVATYTPPPMGSEVELTLQLETQNPLHLRGKVCWIRTVDTESEFAPAGCGIQWTNLTPEAQKIISAFVGKRDTIFHDDD
ncbi:MAG: TIGR02266 family protein [Polyangia bacterium]